QPCLALARGGLVRALPAPHPRHAGDGEPLETPRHQPMQLWTFSLLCCAESALLGRLSFLLVEEPCRRLARNLAARRSRVRVPRPPRRLRGLAQAAHAAQ